MITKIIIRILPETIDKLEWLSLDGDNLLLEQGFVTAQQLTEMASIWQGIPVTLIVPGQHCISIHQQTPAKSQRQIKAALPYTVEDQFAEDIEALHFAIGFRDADNKISAVVVNIEQMSLWLKWFSDAGIIPKLATADHQALPHPADAAFLLASDNYSLLRLKSGVSYSIHNNILPQILMQLSTPLKTADDEELQLDKLLIFNAEKLTDNITESLAEYWNLQIDANHDETQTTPPATSNELLFLAQNIENSAAINFLQGRFKLRSPASKHWLLWKTSTIAAAIIIGLLVAVWSLDFISLNKNLAALKQAHISVYKNAFPGETKVFRPVSQMRGKINALGGGSNQGVFFPLMSKFAIALSKVKDTEITNINFRAKKGELKISFLATDFAAIQKLQAELKAQQLDVSPGASNAAGDKYSGRFTIKEKI